MTFVLRPALAVYFACACGIAQSNSFVVQDPPKLPEEQRACFTLPPGFEVQLVASEPDIRKPMQLAFDEKGRLLVSTSTDYPLGPAEGAAPSDKLMMIEIDGETGKAASITTLVDGLNIPSGVETLPGNRIILAHAPDTLLLHHTDGVVDSREVLYTGFARDDTHELPNSFTWGVDGWLYGLQGHVNKSDVKDKNGTITPVHFGNTFRMWPDGSKIEVYAPGMSNPWGLAFDERYNLFATDCESRPLWQIVEAFAYQGFNQPKAPAGYAPNITTDNHGASGFAGLVYFDAETFPQEYRGHLYLGNPMLGRVHSDGLKGEGFTRFADRKPDFIASSDRWFRPVDLELGPDGALYIADWYNSIISHVEVRLDHPGRDKSRGRIWRVVYRGTDEERADARRREQIDRPFAGPMAIDWSSADRRALIDALGHSQSWIRRMAANQLSYRFADSLRRPAMRLARNERASDVQRAEALWLAWRIAAAHAADLVKLTHASSALVRAQSVRLLALADDSQLTQLTERELLHVDEALLALLDDADPTVRTNAMLSMRARPTAQSATALLNAKLAAVETDPLTHHAVAVSLGAHVMTTDVLLDANAAELDSAARERLAKALTATPTRPAADALARLILDRLVPRDFLAPAAENALTYGDSDAVMSGLGPMLANLDTYENDLGPIAAAIINTIRAKPERTPALSNPLERIVLAMLDSSQPDARRLAAEAGTLFRSAALAPAADNVIRDANQDAHARRNAAVALMRLDFDRYAPAIAALVGDPSDSIPARRAMAEELATRSKTTEQVDALIAAIKDAPGEVKLGAVQRLLQQKPGVTLLFDAIEAEKLSPAHLTAPLFDIFVYWAHRDPAITARFDALVARAPSVSDENEKTIAYLKEKLQSHTPDASRGKAVFEKNCMVCHRLGGQGAMRGPNLDGVGNRGIDRVLQDVVTPSQDVDPAFRTTVITTNDGVVMSGLLVRETPSEMVLADAEGNETVFPRGDVLETRREWISPMPSGLAQAIPETEFLDALGYLMRASK
ncbi:MAG: c-type cytochrome [Candidatus Hydrogenedentes bacterium]|nr:c-type cytochrome [Candidatus Hydrogenedentota bacterium]